MNKNTHTAFAGRRKFLLALMFPFLLVLSGCQVDASMTVSAAGGLTTDVIVRDPSGTIKAEDFDCDSLLNNNTKFLGVDTENVTNSNTPNKTDWTVICKMHGFTGNAIDGEILTDNGSTYTLRLDPSAVVYDTSATGDSLEYSLKISMPGDIVSASQGGVIKGNTVTYSGRIMSSDSDEIVVEAKKSGSSLPVWLLAVAGGVVILAVVALLGVRYRKSLPFFGGSKNENDEPENSFGDDSLALPDIDSDDEDSELDSVRFDGGSDDGSDDVSVPDDDPIVGRHVSSVEEWLGVDSEIEFSAINTDELVDADDLEHGIGLVKPQHYGPESSAVVRENIMPALPLETEHTSPIPGMPPRMPKPGEELEDFDISEVIYPDKNNG